MKITVFEARAFAIQRLNDVLVKPPTVDMVFSLDDDENNRIIAALAKGLKPGLAAMKLVQFGMADRYDDAKRMVDKALWSVDKKN